MVEKQSGNEKCYSLGFGGGAGGDLWSSGPGSAVRFIRHSTTPPSFYIRHYKIYDISIFVKYRISSDNSGLVHPVLFNTSDVISSYYLIASIGDFMFTSLPSIKIFPPGSFSVIPKAHLKYLGSSCSNQACHTQNFAFLYMKADIFKFTFSCKISDFEKDFIGNLTLYPFCFSTFCLPSN